jgi:hypothetical protein
MNGRAYISDDGLYRYSLSRDLGSLGGEGVCTFVMLNPSTADATQDDPTIRRCVRFAREWGYAQLKVVNLYAFRATDPRDLLRVTDPIGPENDHVLSLAFGASDLTVAAWGVHAQPDRVATIMDGPLHPRFCLGVTKNGSPRHPLYVPASARPQRFGIPETAEPSPLNPERSGVAR